MKLDDFNRLSGNTAHTAPAQKRERLRRELEGRGVSWNDMYQELEMSHRYVDAYRHESRRAAMCPSTATAFMS